MRLFRRHTDKTPEDPALRDTERRVQDLTERADRVHERLRPRMDRNHWSETVYEAWTGRAST